MVTMSISIGSDHAGFELKSYIIKYLAKKQIETIDCGCFSNESVDYPDFAHLVASSILSKKSEYGILVCGTGIGISIAANKHKGIRAAVCNSVDLAKISREHNDANILAFGARIICDNVKLVEEIIDTFLATKFEGGRHKRRVDKIDL